MASFEHRINMCRLAFEDIATVSDAEYQSWKRAAAARPEYERDQVNVGTASLLEYLQETEPDVTFWFCLGADAFLDLTDGKWKESAQVLHLLQGRIVVLKRQPDSSKVDSTTEQVCDAALLERIEGTPGSKLLSLPSLNEVSSSQVRSTRDERELESMVIPAVLNYMKMHKLYAFA
jgi:nicotinic acid mononucleotide adenylyltransferase